MSVHTELEGNRWTGFLAAFIEHCIERSYRFERLIDIAAQIKQTEPPVCECLYGAVRGRAGEVTCQGTAIIGAQRPLYEQGS